MSIPEEEFPESLTDIKDVIGYEGAMTLLNKCAGTRLFIPKNMKVQHKLAELLGFEQARLMSKHFGGETISIVRAARAKRIMRNREIIRCYDNGERVPDIALKVQLTERQIYTILSQGDF
jgi:Mor family transcriptional regulator